MRIGTHTYTLFIKREHNQILLLQDRYDTCVICVSVYVLQYTYLLIMVADVVLWPRLGSMRKLSDRLNFPDWGEWLQLSGCLCRPCFCLSACICMFISLCASLFIYQFTSSLKKLYWSCIHRLQPLSEQNWLILLSNFLKYFVAKIKIST